MEIQNETGGATRTGPQRLLTVSDVSELLGVNRQTVLKWVRHGDMGCVRLGLKNIRFRQEHVDEFVAAREAAAVERKKDRTPPKIMGPVVNPFMPKKIAPPAEPLTLKQIRAALRAPYSVPTEP